MLSNNVILKLPDFSSEFTITTDASAVGIGAVLEQSNGPIAFASRSLNKAERNYSATDREFLALIWGIKKFKQYLYGKYFKCRTDHKPLLAMVKSAPLNSRHARYLQILEEFDFSLNYISGSDNIPADFLSRIPTGDDICTDKVNQITCSVSSIDDKRKLVPDSEIDEMVKKHHEYGHLGFQKTKSSILNSNYWFHNMKSRIKEHINNCLTCAQNKSYSSHCKSGILPKDNVQPFEVVSIDIVGPLSPSSNRYTHILTMEDNASRWVEACPLTNIRAETVSKAIVDRWIHRFGPPRYFLSDNGTQFTSQIFKDLADRFKFKHKCTTIYHPQGNSIVERFHRVLKDRLRCLGGSWSEKLQEAVWHHNRTDPVDKNKTSPFQFIYGRKPTIPIEWPNNNEFRTYLGKCPRLACPKNFQSSSLQCKFLPPVKVASRLSDQLIKLCDGRILNIKNTRLIW